MTAEEAVAIIEMISARFEKHCVMRGLQILAESNPSYDGGITAEHDQIWANIDFEESVKNMTPEQVGKMSSLGWHRCHDIGGWTKSV